MEYEQSPIVPFDKETSEPISEFASKYEMINSFKDIVEEEEDNDGQDTNIKEENKSSQKDAIITITKTIMGSSILCLPYVMKTLGFIFGFLFLLLNAIVAWKVVDLLLKCKDITKKFGYSMYGKITLGSLGTILVKLMIAIGNFGFSCVYYKVFGNLMDVVITTITGRAERSEFYLQPWFFITLAFFIIIPLIVVDNQNLLNKASVFGIIGLSTFLLLIFVIFLKKLFSGEVHYDNSMLWPKADGGFIEILGSLPTVILAFSFHFNVFPIYFTLKHRTNKEMLVSSSVAISLSFFFYLGVGILGYLMYANSDIGVQSIMINNLQNDLKIMNEDPSNKNVLLYMFYLIGIIAFLLSCVVTVPLVFIGTKTHFMNLILFIKRKNHALITSSNISISSFQKLLITLILYGGVLFVTLTVDNIMMLFSFIGSTSSSAISLILPGLFLILLLKSTGIEEGRYWARFVIGLGILGIISFYVPEIIKLFK